MTGRDWCALVQQDCLFYFTNHYHVRAKWTRTTVPWLCRGNKGITWFGDELEACDILTHIKCSTGSHTSKQQHGGTRTLYISYPVRAQCCWMGCFVAPATNKNCKNPVNNKQWFKHSNPYKSNWPRRSHTCIPPNLSCISNLINKRVVMQLLHRGIVLWTVIEVLCTGYCQHELYSHIWVIYLLL